MTVDTRFEQPSAADPSTLAMWESLSSEVAEALERKRRLGQYWVLWTSAGPQIHQPEAPSAVPDPSKPA